MSQNARKSGTSAAPAPAARRRSRRLLWLLAAAIATAGLVLLGAWQLQRLQRWSVRVQALELAGQGKLAEAEPLLR